jgi:replicative DNA helicase
MDQNNNNKNFQAIRVPPQNIEAEMSILGALMLDPNAIIKVADALKQESFYRQGHGQIYSSMLELFEKKEPIDILSVSAKLKEKKILESIGGTAYLTSLINSVPSASNVSYYAEIVRKKHVLRNLIEASQHLTELSYKEDEDVERILDEAERKIFSISKKALKQKFLNVKSALVEAWERIDRLHKSKDELRGVPTGFKGLDNILAGLQKSDLVILAARPSLGKTALALDMARNAAIKHNIPVGIFSLEMSTQQIIDRFLAAESGIDLWKIRTGRLSAEKGDFDHISHALEKLSGAPIYIDDEASNNILQVRTMARRLQIEHGLGLLIIDYLQMMRPMNSSESMVQQITEISRSLKSLARELDIPVLALSQLSRAVEQRPRPIPRLSDLRESGSIEQDADVVMMIYREDRYKENSSRENQADIIITKHRNGQLGKVTLYFNPERASFSDLEKETIPDFEETFIE